MARQTLDDLLSKARDGLHGENIITLLGEPDAGKTVVLTLLKHALFHKFVPFHGGKFEALVAKGGEEVDVALRGMKENGIFPSSTIPTNSPHIELEIYKMSGEGAGKIKLMLQDVSGENYMSLLCTKFDDSKQRLEAILTRHNGSGSVGSLAPYVFSKVYMLVIERASENPDRDAEHSRAIYALHQTHNAAKLTRNNKIKTDIAVLFTKSDALDGDDLSAPAPKLLERMPKLESALKKVHGGKLECFKLAIDVQRESPQDRDRRVIRSRQCANDRLKHEQRVYDQKLTKFVAQSAERARKEAESAYGEEVDESEYDADAVSRCVKEAESKAEQKFRSLNHVPVLDFDECKENKLKYRVRDGFTYSQDEYVRLIDWLIDRLYG